MERARLTYLALVVGFIAAIALLRLDLFLAAGKVTLLQLERGGPARWKLIGEVLLFGGILLATARLIPARVEPRRDGAIAVLATVAGFVAEYWGTHAGLWTYYTRERPPLWIVPAWTLGALVIDRLGSRAESTLAPRCGAAAHRAAYWTLLIFFLLVTMSFVFPRPSLASYGGLAALAAALAYRAEARRDAWLFAAGLACVFFADLWGVTNNCWRYHTQAGRSPGGAAFGILFGMFFDTAVVLACLKAARGLALKAI
ncbi:MAG: hypothetical protein AAB576_10095 [Elusimicrobiota bacterium]